MSQPFSMLSDLPTLHTVIIYYVNEDGEAFMLETRRGGKPAYNLLMLPPETRTVDALQNCMAAPLD